MVDLTSSSTYDSLVQMTMQWRVEAEARISLSTNQAINVGSGRKMTYPGAKKYLIFYTDKESDLATTDK
jgi:hypothetical protein